MLKTRTWILLFALILLLCALAALWLYFRPAEGTVANIYQNGKLVDSIDLSRVTEPRTLEYVSDAGYNRIEIEPGRIRVAEADCPDGICVAEGWRSDSARPIVCLPHRLVIRLVSSEEEIDAVSQ